MENTVSNQLDYKIYDFTHPTYQFSKCLPVSGGNSWNISAAGQEILIELPVKAYNFSKSVLYFQLVSLDAGLSGQIGNGLQQWTYADCLALIRQMQLYTRSNIYVADIYELQNYTSIVWKPLTKLQNYLTFDQATNAGAGQTVVPNVMNNSGYARFLQPSNVLLTGLSNIDMIILTRNLLDMNLFIFMQLMLLQLVMVRDL
jgi:hypothetical protein